MESSIQAKGKWINISETRLTNDIEVISFESGELEYCTYYFQHNKDSLQPSKVKDTFKKLFDLDFRYVTENRIKFKVKGAKKDIINEDLIPIYSNSIYSQDYMQLVPTKLEISENDVLRLKYVFYWREENHLIKFNESLDPPELKAINEKIGSDGRIIFLEKVEKTFLVSFYINKKRKWIFPIKEVDSSKMIINGLPEKPYEVTAVRLGEEKKNE
jgi:hypothetical protein